MKLQIDYQSLTESSNKYGETNDCAVKAIAVVLNTSYEDAHTLLKKFGRKDCQGTKWIETTMPALYSRFFKIRTLLIPSYIRTIQNLEEYANKYKFDNPLLIQTSRHIIGFVNGKAQDYTSGRRHRIIAIHEVISTEKSIYSVDINNIDVNPTRKRRVKAEYKYALAHQDTGEVYIRYKKKPAAKTQYAIKSGEIWIKGKKEETLGKLRIIEI